MKGYKDRQMDFESPNRVRFNSQGEILDIERARAQSQNSGLRVVLNYGKRFCKCCNQYKPKNKKKAHAKWRCDDCVAEGRTFD